MRVNCSHNCTNDVLLATASIMVADSHNNKHVIRALLDCGSQGNFITKQVVTLLGLEKKPSNVLISGFENIKTYKTFETFKLTISSRNGSFSDVINCHIVNQITSDMPSCDLTFESISVPKNIILADPEFQIPDKIDILLGAGIFLEDFTSPKD